MYKMRLAALAALVVLGSFGAAAAQTDHVKRLQSPATVHGFIGGEAHDSYVIHARKGETITVRLNWRRHRDDRAEFSVSKGKNFQDASPVNFGKASNGGKTWTGRSPATRDYYISVVATPSAHYTLSVTVK